MKNIVKIITENKKTESLIEEILNNRCPYYDSCGFRCTSDCNCTECIRDRDNIYIEYENYSSDLIKRKLEILFIGKLFNSLKEEIQNHILNDIEAYESGKGDEYLERIIKYIG